ncbi:DUF1097 domain-containing protein [Clostridium septicum]|uniref:DUF1097 domain-containing protein n=1 Tax=Clostridium septicum TaxID=1504 RepID=A0A9N7PMT6_CLOSE|nr:DUF1097 domain-containing protein [Clostridium septicum]AYE35597.1 DUF1097 domain-containing protein [Clostridium septicum]QAS60983.1 DUF1097 domain-containing protein [Clostridium septicum]UEC19738.1 DUF1097 domain-containing protein [Clostridium septicum]USS02202.1 DUF1097 domain-containing protein [Clostridium septicum]WLF70781.1 DUF1097 domain-containing protein [Clostridium septicum]
MDLLTMISISVGILSGVWGFVSASLGLITWVGFIGCTSYYASGGEFVGFKKSIYANITGVFWGMCIIICSSQFEASYWSYIFTGVFSFVMCIQAKYKKLDFIPGAFCGACCIFGTGGEWQAVIIALLCGAVLGYLSDKGGQYLYKLSEHLKSK